MIDERDRTLADLDSDEDYDDSEPCGENMCHCGCGENHVCACDCERCWECLQRAHNCQCEG